MHEIITYIEDVMICATLITPVLAMLAVAVWGSIREMIVYVRRRSQLPGRGKRLDRRAFVFVGFR